MRQTVRFYEAQWFRQRRVRIVLAVPPLCMTLMVVWQVGLGHSAGRQPMSNAGLEGWMIFLWLVYLRLITVRLVTQVRGGVLTLQMRGLWRARRIRQAEIKSVKTVTYDPVRDCGGYGIRMTSQGKAYTAGGTRGVRIELAGGGTVLIGSERPDELAAALGEGRG
ncbi:MAG: hypothetical protein ABI165_20205 [Bryobacteraceae bacterium]